MNYWIQGDAANADKIKAAFEKLGMDCASDYNYQSERMLYFTFDGKVVTASCESYKAIIKTHPDYEELELPKPHYDIAFMGIGDSYSQCIPFEGNEHLLGTTYMPSEEFINW